jgi:membrane protein YqaA with SNARE-associated domain
MDSRIDRFVKSRMALVLAFIWGFSEAVFFFFVPDVLLTAIAARSMAAAIKASVAALAGALIGGAVMVVIAHTSPETARTLLLHIPGIHANLLERVAGQIEERQLVAVLLGPLKGIPYKIFAVEWGSRHGAMIPFLLISIPARYVRFAAAAGTANLIARVVAGITKRRAEREWVILGGVWVVFYGFYFWRFGW